MKSIQKVGAAMSVAALLSFAIYTLCFGIILVVNEPFSWSGISALARYEAANHTAFKYIGMVCMIAYACIFFVMVLCVEKKGDPEKELLQKIASGFALLFCATICINYFVQLTATRLQLGMSMHESLLQFTQSYNISAINAINMLGWTLFYPISSLALALSLRRVPHERWLGRACLCNTVVMSAGFVGYMLNHEIMLMITMNVLLGGCSVWMIVCFQRYFTGPKTS